MRYIYESERRNYEDFASGRVIYNQRGATAFPVRLASEVFLRSKEYLTEKNVESPLTIYDPCCGGAYLLTILGFLHGNYIEKIIASDIDKEMVDLAQRNLHLLTSQGIDERIREIKNYINDYNKKSHKDALSSAIKLKSIQENIDNFELKCFRADALNINNFNFKVDLIIADLPYGNITTWSKDKKNNIDIFLNNLLKFVKITSIVTIITSKKQKIKHSKYNRIKHFTIGKRRVSFLEPLNSYL